MTWSSNRRNRPHHRSKVWQLGKQLVLDVYGITAEFPDHERFGLTSQIRRAAVSIPSNIAEGMARDSDPDLLRFLHSARGSADELDTQMELAEGLGYLDGVDVHDARDTFDNTSRALQGLITKVKSDIAKN